MYEGSSLHFNVAPLSPRKQFDARSSPPLAREGHRPDDVQITADDMAAELHVRQSLLEPFQRAIEELVPTDFGPSQQGPEIIE